MVSPEKIVDKLSRLDEYRGILKKVLQTPVEFFLNDKMLFGGSKYYLQVSIGCCLDVSNHIIAAEGFRPPKDYADSFKVLEENDILDKHLGMRLRQTAKFLNRLVHLYGEVDDAYVYEFISGDLKDISDFKKLISVRYLSPQSRASSP